MKKLTVLTLAALIGLGTLPALAENIEKGGHEGRGHHFMEKADADKDGYLTKDEMRAVQQQRLDNMFTNVDSDKDGKLSKDELKTGREKMRAEMRERFKDRKNADQKPE